jgi:2-dehydro-3-deoxyphosphogluconate aldolase / (4S)-4-hydroxy-2-oxoglutarate aldolase
MQNQDLLDRIVEGGIVAVVRTPDADTARRAVDAVLAGGVTAVEVTFTVPDAAAVIRSVAADLPDGVVLGAGTVTDAERARIAIEAGARFIVSPNTDASTIQTAVQKGVVAIPGALTPTEIVNAVSAGADAVKIFPATSFGPGYIKALRGPLPDVIYCPTGGVDLDNIPDYVAAGAAMFGIGGNLVDLKLISAGRYDEITDRARRFVDAVREARQRTEGMT